MSEKNINLDTTNHTNGNPASGELLSKTFPNNYGKAPKSRTKFTLSHSTLENALSRTYEANDLAVASSSKSSSCITNFGNLSPILLTKDKRSLHGSMENLHKPKDHRSDYRLHEISTKTKDNAEINGRLIHENMRLMKVIEDTRKKTLALQVTRAFSFEAFRRQRNQNEALQAAKRRKEEECAVRMILHNLLLNSWRNCKLELENLLADNVQLNKTMENLSMQLRVVRHLQTVEKEKAIEKTNEIDRMKNEITFLKTDNEKSHLDVERMENELNSFQEKVQNLQEHNQKIENDIQIFKEENKTLAIVLGLEREKSEELEKNNATLKDEAIGLNLQLSEITSKNNHWQERSRSLESESWELKLEIESRNTKINEIKATCDGLKEDKAKLMRMKSSLKEKLDETSEKLEETNFDKEELTTNLHEANFNMQEQIVQIDNLEVSLTNAKKEYTEVEKELLTYKLQNVKRRREWANALYFIVNPVDTIRRTFMGARDDDR